MGYDQINKKKLIPIIFIVVLSIVAIILLISLIAKKNSQNNTKNPYTKLIIKYNGETNEYTDLPKVSNITIGEYKFTLGAVEPSRVIIYTNRQVSVNNKAYTDVEINGGKEYKVCFDTDDCFTAQYVR